MYQVGFSNIVLIIDNFQYTSSVICTVARPTYNTIVYSTLYSIEYTIV